MARNRQAHCPVAAVNRPGKVATSSSIRHLFLALREVLPEALLHALAAGQRQAASACFWQIGAVLFGSARDMLRLRPGLSRRSEHAPVQER